MSDFLAFLQNLAPEGETILFTHQIPTKETYLDGKVKCVWPATKSTRKIKAGESWYVNSGCFIVDRFKDGKPSAAAANCDRVAMLLIDDVGTKVPAPPLPATWVMETSEGNFQHVYVFSLDGQPTLGEYRAAWAAIAAAGMTDAGADGPVRNIRLPGSVNMKPGRNGFVSRLVEFHPEREFTLPQICEAFGVTPGEAQGRRINVSIEDDGNDDVLAWLSAQGLVTERGNSAGWWGVQCPAAEEHSDGASGARYLPSNRAFICYHSHGDKWNSAAFLQWVESQGGPKHESGLRDDLVAEKMREALAKLPAPTLEYPDAATQVIAEVDRREAGRVEKADWYKRFAYNMRDDSFFDLTDRSEISRWTFNAMFRHIGCNSIHNAKRRVEASVCFDENRQESGARVLAGITYAAGDGVLVARDGLVYGNKWRDTRRPRGTGGDASRWLAHVENIVGDMMPHVLDVLAHKLQFPAVKINHALLIGGPQGCGKDLMLVPFLHAMGGNYETVRDMATLIGGWGYVFEREIIILNELKEPEAKERRALSNRLKDLIAAPPDLITVQRKGLAPYDAANRVLVMAFTNDYSPLSIESDDRRMCCIWTKARKMEDDEGESMMAYYAGGGYDAVRNFLYERDVSAFKPGMRAPMTEWKQSMIENSLAPAESAILSEIRAGTGEFKHGVVAGPWQAVAARMSRSQDVRVHPNAVLHALRESDWIDKERVMSREYPTARHMFVRPDLAHLSKSELRRMVETELPPTGTDSLAKTVGHLKAVK